jgi:hypothetical protein
MIVEGELADWGADRRRQRDTSDAANRVALAWGQGPVHRRFSETFAIANDCDAVAAAARDLFADDGWLDSLIDALAAEMRRNRFFEPPFRALNTDLHTGLIVYEDDKVTIAAGISRAAQLAGRKTAKRSAASVNFTGQVSVLKFVKAGRATLSFWEAPEIGLDFSAESAGLCRKRESRRIGDGEIVTVDGRREAYVIDHVRSNILLVQAVVKAGQAPLSVEYDSASGTYVGCSAVDDSDSRIQMITTLVRKLGRADAVPVLARFLDHPSFFVRWHVMREMLGLDVAAALPNLRRMAEADPHPDARQAAGSVLDRAEQALRRAA